MRVVDSPTCFGMNRFRVHHYSIDPPCRDLGSVSPITENARAWVPVAERSEFEACQHREDSRMKMNTRSANHYVLVGTIDGIIDTSGLGGAPTVNIRLDGKPLPNAELCDGDGGIEVTALVEQVPDLRTVRL